MSIVYMYVCMYIYTRTKCFTIESKKYKVNNSSRYTIIKQIRITCIV